MKSQRGLTDYDVFLPIVIVVILAAVAIPNFMNARDREKRRACVQALGAWRRGMNLSEHLDGKGSYPVKLKGRKYTDTADAELINTFSKYMNVTNTLRDCRSTFFIFVLPETFTITAIANDRRQTPLTGMLDFIR